MLERREHALFSGLVGPIWTLHRDYPERGDPEEFRHWSVHGTARVLFANWVQAGQDGGAVLHSETHVRAIGRQARFGLATLRPVIHAFQQLILIDGIAAAGHVAETRRGTRQSVTPSP